MFFRFVFSGDGIAPDPKKVEAIKDSPGPTTATGTCSFLGRATYCTEFIPNISTVFAPLRELTKKDKPFHWSAPKEQSFKKVKRFSQVPKSFLTLIPRRKQSS